MPKPLRKFFDEETGAAARARRFGRRVADSVRSGVNRLRGMNQIRRNRRAARG